MSVPQRDLAIPVARKPLRFLTAGSVDDGKSTLIGRLLLDSQAILADQLDGLERRAAGAPIDLSLLTDGLEAEREQGITIDVAYRYFATRERKFIIADAPGHEQYTRNMVTAAAGSDAAVVLVDVTKLDVDAEPLALLPQTRRHALLAQLLRVPHIVFAVNKLDAVADPARAFARVRDALAAFAQAAGIVTSGIVPISALRGDNVTTPSGIAGYDGPTLLALLEHLPDEAEPARGSLLLPVQFVSGEASGSGAGHRSRVLWGRVARDSVSVGDTVAIFPSGEAAQVTELHAAGERVRSVVSGRSAGVVLDRQLDVSRGDWLA
ncbi:MAG: GTP-binding protein, partial [Caldimonas sp.]